MDDLISRKEAVDAIHCDIMITGARNAETVAKTIDEFVCRIKALPSAQPQLVINDSRSVVDIAKITAEMAKRADLVAVIRCKNCKWFGDIGCAIGIVDDTDKPSEEDYCSFAERRTDG